MSTNITNTNTNINNTHLRISIRILAIASVILLAAMVIPVLYVSRYAYPWADDFTYSWTVRAVYAETHNPIKTILQAIHCSLDQYMNWQGTYTSCFLMSCQPAVFGTRGYHITAYIMIGSILLSYFLLSYAIIVKKFHSSISAAVILFSLTALVTIENVIGQAEAFTWYNSAVHYTFNHALFVLFLACMIMCRNKAQIIFTLIIGFFAAGGNNITVFGGLLFLILFEMFLLFLAVTDKTRTNAPKFTECSYFKHFLYFLPYTAVFAVGAVINFAAPGNQERLSESGGQKAGIINTIFTSFRLGSIKCITWFNGTTLFLIIASIILALFVFKYSENNAFNIFRFQHPWFTGLISFCIFSALNAPVVYTSGSVDMLRTDNAQYYIYILLIVFNCFYITGNLYLKISHNNIITKKQVIVAALLLSASFAAMILWNNTLKKQDPTTFLTDSALYSIENGGASYYGYEMQENTNRLKTEAADVKVMRMVVDPSILYPHDAEDWIMGTRLYYNKNCVEYE